MNGHLETWINAYLDGELSAIHKRQADTHLAECQSCRDLLAQRKNLTALLQGIPPASGLKPEARFVTEVGLQLKPRREATRLRTQVMYLGWQFFPVALLLALAFVQTVFTLTSIVGMIPGANQILATGVTFLPELPMLPGQLNDLLNILGVFNSLDWNLFTGMAAVLVISLIYVCWLVGWWVWNRRLAASLG
jgi:predicted anti-sigma-YlaC factor YlaD